MAAVLDGGETWMRRTIGILSGSAVFAGLFSASVAAVETGGMDLLCRSAQCELVCYMGGLRNQDVVLRRDLVLSARIHTISASASVLEYQTAADSRWRPGSTVLAGGAVCTLDGMTPPTERAAMR